LKQKILMLVVAAMMMVASALPAFAQPVDPECGWDWDRYLWSEYRYELWYFGCDYGEDGFNVYAFWNPDYGYWYP
jgi:hypothetical protein